MSCTYPRSLCMLQLIFNIYIPTAISQRRQNWYIYKRGDWRERVSSSSQHSSTQSKHTTFLEKTEHPFIPSHSISFSTIYIRALPFCSHHSHILTFISKQQLNMQIKLQGVGKLHHRCHFLKKTLQLVVSVALLSFFLCHSSGFSLFPHSFNVYFSTLLFSFFTHTLERKYMFLICNGILAFLAKSSVSTSSSDLGPQTSTSSTNLTQTKALSAVRDDEVALRFSGGGDYDVPPVAEGEEAEDTCKDKQVEEQGEEGNDECLGREEEERESESEVSVIVEDVDDKEGESGLVMQEEAGDHKEEPSTEELNRKIEEFIRKMKEEIRIEAQRQLIAV